MSSQPKPGVHHLSAGVVLTPIQPPVTAPSLLPGKSAPVVVPPPPPGVRQAEVRASPPTARPLSAAGPTIVADDEGDCRAAVPEVLSEPIVRPIVEASPLVEEVDELPTPGKPRLRRAPQARLSSSATLVVGPDDEVVSVGSPRPSAEEAPALPPLRVAVCAIQGDTRTGEASARPSLREAGVAVLPDDEVYEPPMPDDPGRMVLRASLAREPLAGQRVSRPSARPPEVPPSTPVASSPPRPRHRPRIRPPARPKSWFKRHPNWTAGGVLLLVLIALVLLMLHTPVAP